jgi:zinc transport system substrate-binding protein
VTRSVFSCIVFVVLIGSLAGGCRRTPAATDRLPVTASFYPLYEFASRVGGERVAVRSLVPPGVEPHDYEPTPQDVAALTRVRVLVYNGAGFEPWVGKLLAQIPASAVRVDASEGLPLITGGAGDDSRARGAPDPHVWLDPLLAVRQVDRIVDGLTAADPDGRGVYVGNGTQLKNDLEALHRRFTARLATCRHRQFITSHAAFGYLARRYGLTQVAITGVDPESEPSPARLKQIIQEARRTGTRVIYYETLVTPRMAEVIAREVGARTAVLNPIEGLTPDEQRRGETYFTLMDANLKALAGGLDCR